jgi:hypothetical protein
MSDLLAKLVDKKYWLSVSVVLIAILCAVVLLIGRRPIGGLLVYPNAHLNPTISPNCQRIEPIKLGQGITKKEWVVSSSSHSCFTTSDTMDQVWDWHEQAGWGFGGGKCPCLARTTYYLKGVDLGFVSMEANRIEKMYIPFSRGNTTLIDYLVYYSLRLHFR